MDANSQRPKGRDSVLSSLNMAIEALNLAKEISGITPAKAAFGSVSVLLAMIRDSMMNERDYVEVGLSCADICNALGRGVGGKKLDDLSQSVCEAINQLTITVAEVQRKVTERGGRNAFSRLFHAKNDRETIANWKSDLNRILHVFNTELAVNTSVTVSDIHRDVSRIREEIGSQVRSVQNRLIASTIKETSVFGEPPPSPPRACFGRGELIDKIVGLAEGFTPIALIGAGGIGKTSIALTVLHHDRIKERFGDNRRFIRCDQFPASRTHFLAQLSKVTGAGVENPEDLTALRSSLSSRDMILVLDNAESVLDPQGTGAREIYAVVEELSHLTNICLCITSRISTIPPDCETLDVPTLSIEAARDTLYRIYKNSERSDLVDRILGQLDFHPLSITLLATVAHHNKWNNGRLAKEWDTHRTRVLRTDHNKSLAATIELSLASPTFRELGPNVRDLLGVIAFFPQGINEDNLDWLLPATPNGLNTFDKFCALSLTHRTNGFITMLAPLRDYLRPRDPKSSPLLCMTKERYFSKLSVFANPDQACFEESRWIQSEDGNVEHLLDIFTTIDATSGEVWDACAHFMEHLYWHKKRLVILGPRIERVPDDHPSKPECLFQLSRLFRSVGNVVGSRQLLIRTLGLWREQGDDLRVADTLKLLSDTSRALGLYKEGVLQAIEALGIHQRLNDVPGQVLCLQGLGWLLHDDNEPDAAKEAALGAVKLLSGGGDPFLACDCHRLLGLIYRSKGEAEKAIDHFKIAFIIASSYSLRDLVFWVDYHLAELLFKEGRFDCAYSAIEHAKSQAIDNPYFMARAVILQALFWYQQRRLEEARSGALRAADVFERFGATDDLEVCKALVRSADLGGNGESVISGG